MENYNTRFIKKFSQLNSDMQSYRCKDFSLKQVSGLMGGPDPPDPPPGSATALVPFDILSTAFGKCTYQCKPRGGGGECGQGVGIWQILKFFDQIPRGGKRKVNQKCQKSPHPRGKI